jgi:hypothetical protein
MPEMKHKLDEILRQREDANAFSGVMRLTRQAEEVFAGA